MQVDQSIRASNDAPSTPANGALGQAMIYCCLLFALLPLLVIHAGPDAPIWKVGTQNWPQANAEHQLASESALFISAANGGNLSLHFEGFTPPFEQQGLLICQTYFLANYALYPHRAYVGKGDRIINFPEQLLAGDIVPDDSWRHHHDINAVLTLHHPANGTVETSTWEIHP